MIPRIPGFLYDEHGFIIGKDEDYYRVKNGGATAPPTKQDWSDVGGDSGVEMEEPVIENIIEEQPQENDNSVVPEKSFRLRKFPVQEPKEIEEKPVRRRRIIRRPQQQMMYQQPGMPFIPPPIGADWQPQPPRPFVENPEVTLVHAGMRNVIKNLVGSTNGIYLPGVNAPMIARPQGRQRFRRSRRSRQSRRG